MIYVDLIIVALIIYAAFVGTRRGAVLVGFELLSFLIATAVALLTYHPVGSWIKNIAGTSPSLGNVAGFMLIWVLVEVSTALIFRFLFLPHFHRDAQLSRLNQIGGSALNAFKFTIMVALALVVLAGLPLSAGAKQAITGSFISKYVLSSSSQLQSWLAGGLGRDLGESLNFFTVTAEPESEQRIDLGYTTTGTVDARSEDAMLVLVNEERTSRGLKPLTMNDKAREVARAYSADMFGRGYFSHINPEGKSPFYRMKQGGVKFRTAGENLALAPTLNLAHQGLMNSPGHRENILKAEYRTVGIGIIDGGPHGLMVTQNFTD